MIVGIHHFGLTVRDVDTSAAWYERVLGFRRVGEFAAPDGARRKVFLRHDGLAARLGLTQHRDEWQRRLTEAGVVHSPIAGAITIDAAAVLVLRDPDNIQLELFHHPATTDPATTDPA